LFSDAYGFSLDVASFIDRALEAAESRFNERGWQDALREPAAERGWLSAHRAVFATR
jgi:hypothetical protein